MEEALSQAFGPENHLLFTFFESIFVSVDSTSIADFAAVCHIEHAHSNSEEEKSPAEPEPFSV